MAIWEGARPNEMAYRTLRRPVLLVGLSGPSGVGKSTLIQALSSQYNCPLKEITGDGYWKAAKHHSKYPHDMKDAVGGVSNSYDPANFQHQLLLNFLDQTTQHL